ncbi:MAG: bifunctional adenosylcobinamide kinase/adenosylcobinamide-phosphate guanylyltransferase [Acidimicrobiales bacterium]
MITLVLGGARSGKSEVGERLLAGLPAPRTFLGTWAQEDSDPDMGERVAIHRQRRPAEWGLVEVEDGDLAAAVTTLEGSVLIDGLGTWVAQVAGFAADGAELAGVLRRRNGGTVVVSEEVGLGVHPETDVGRRFRDELGRVNREIADAADEVLLVVAGRTLRL